MTKYKIRLERWRDGKKLDWSNERIVETTYFPPKIGEGNMLLVYPPIEERIVSVEEIFEVKKPATCTDVKCMMKDCTNEAYHKVGEQNIWDKETEPDEYRRFNMSHGLTTYLCIKHFNILMHRDEHYS